MRSSMLRRTAWNWLPAFLAVAESGSVTQACRELGLTPAAISRTIRLLEDHLGQELFHRSARTLILNVAGQRLRESVRAAVNHVDIGLESLQSDPFTGPLRVATHGAVGEFFVLPSLLELKRKHPGLIPEQVTPLASEASELLLRGAVDVGFHDEALTCERLGIEKLGSITFSVCCGRGHGLYGAARITPEQLHSHLFCVPPTRSGGRLLDGWPAEWRRQVGMRVTLLSSAIQVALSGEMLSVLPDVSTNAYVRTGELFRLPMTLPLCDVFVSTAQAMASSRALQELIALVRARLEEQARSLLTVASAADTARFSQH